LAKVLGAIKPVRPFIFGGMSGMFATCCVQPVDIVKVRIQINSERKALGEKVTTNPFGVAKELI